MKRRRSKGIDLDNPLVVILRSVMAATRGAAREAMAEEVVGRMTEIMAS